MPQMMPINWVSLYTLFFILFFLSIIMNYYVFLYKPKTTKYSKINTQINWKW